MQLSSNWKLYINIQKHGFMWKLSCGLNPLFFVFDTTDIGNFVHSHTFLLTLKDVNKLNFEVIYAHIEMTYRCLFVCQTMERHSTHYNREPL